MSIDKEAHALLIAKAAHYGQIDHGGVPRWKHAEHVGDQFTDPMKRIVGYLHDVLEDSPLVSSAGILEVFGMEVYTALNIITRQKGHRYTDYIKDCAANPIACAVKIADIEHNLDKFRWPEMPESYEKREAKALKILRSAP